MNKVFKGIRELLRRSVRYAIGTSGKRPKRESHDDFDILEEFERFKTGARRGGPAFEGLLEELADPNVTPPPWEPHRTGPTVIGGYERFAELLAPMEVVNYLPRVSPSGIEPPELSTLPIEEFLKALRIQGLSVDSPQGETDFDLTLMPFERILPEGQVEKFLLIRPVKRPLQPDEALAEDFGTPAGWRLAIDPDPILRALRKEGSSRRKPWKGNRLGEGRQRLESS